VLRVERKSLQRQVQDLDLRLRHATSDKEKAKALEDASPDSTLEKVPSRSPSEGNLAQLRDLVVGTTATKGSSLPAERRRPLSASRTTWQHAGGERKQRPNSHVPPEIRKHMTQLLVKADLNQQQIEMQALENKLLRDQVVALSQQRSETGTSSTFEKTHAAGAAHKAVRQAAR